MAYGGYDQKTRESWDDICNIESALIASILGIDLDAIPSIQLEDKNHTINKETREEIYAEISQRAEILRGYQKIGFSILGSLSSRLDSKFKHTEILWMDQT